ncbi:unnamed protein product [Angiostrongylus costaricensis]|uniref:Plus3 domain-containing protein n=1 Tax=Angiostrongylus costaricensis TaxID=334426 RepID=A0A0R3PMS4_ANGCS|nr:unnamed protein product [Angiostrongylus costaricensis]
MSSSDYSSSDDDEKPKVRSQMDDDLFADEEDRRQVMAMNEKDREQEIFNRMEQQEMRRTRSVVKVDKKEKKEKQRKRINESDSDDAGAGSDSESEADMAFHRPSEVHKKATQKNAMADLLAKRKDKENKAAKKAALSIDAVFGKDHSDGSSSSSSSSSSSASSRSSSRGSSPRRDGGKTVSELSRARISRYKIAKIVYAPFFAKTVIGCFVRVGLGGYGGKSKYRLSQVVDVVDTNRVYTFENNKTNKGLKLRYGSDERVFRIEFVSNAEFGEEEFSEWRKVTKEEVRCHICNMDSSAIIYVFLIVREKKKFSDKVKNFALTKGELIKQKVCFIYNSLLLRSSSSPFGF